MINKLLCFMFGHAYEEYKEPHLILTTFGTFKRELIVVKCKHCGEYGFVHGYKCSNESDVIGKNHYFKPGDAVGWIPLPIYRPKDGA